VLGGQGLGMEVDGECHGFLLMAGAAVLPG
jgi:hypothetical protein